MAKKTVNSDIYNLSELVDGVKKSFIPNETDETLAIGTYGYIGAVEAARLQTQVQMTGELCNEVFPSRARLERNVITHAIMTNIEDINAIPAKMTAFLAIKEADISDLFNSNNVFVIDRECPIYIGDFEFHLEYDIKLTRIEVKKKASYAYTARYDIPSNRDVPTSTIAESASYLSPPMVVMVGSDAYIYLTVVLSQVEHSIVSKKLVTSNIIDNKTMNFEFENQLAYFEVHVTESDEEYYLLPVFEGSSVPDSNTQYYCWYQYIDSNLIRVRFDRQSYMPGLNANIECLIKTCKGSSGNFTYGESLFTELSSSNYGYQNISVLLTPVTNSANGKDRKSKKELQSLIPKEALSRGSLTTITDLNNYFGMLDSENGRIIIQKKIDNQIERVYYTYFVAKDQNGDVIPSNTIDIKVDLDEMIKSTITESDSARYHLASGKRFRLDDQGVGYISYLPLPGKYYAFTPASSTRGSITEDTFVVQVNEEGAQKDNVSVAVDVGGSMTPMHIFPADDDDRYAYENSSKEYLVEDYIQMGCGKIYTYSMDYTTKDDNSLITIRDKNLGNMELIDASYTVGDTTRHFSKIPFTAYGLEAGTKMHIDIKRRLNEKTKGVVTFTYDKNTFKLHQTSWKTNLSNLLVGLGFSDGEVESAVSSDDNILLLTENGEINPVDPTPTPTPDPDPDPDPEEYPYRLQVTDSDKLPAISERDKNQWYYAVTKHEERNDSEVGDNMDENATADEYELHVVSEADAPAVEDRKENSYYYVVTSSTERDDIPDDPDVPVVIPEELKGKEYTIEVLQGFMGQTITLLVTISGVDYEIILTHDAYTIENGVYVTEGDNDMVSAVYTTYVPILTQDKWPDELVEGDQITYTLRYKSMSNTYLPELKIKLSEGLDYVIFSNTIKYPDGTTFNFEPTEGSLANEKGFIYTNPYAVNVNSYRLYSSFYMMSMEENPYLHFDFVNDASAVQFIATNAYWTRPFSGPKKDTYTLTATFTQSVQDDLGVIPDTNDENSVPLIKVIAVFKRDGNNYRYRTMNLQSYDSTNYSFTFSQDFNAEDIFDNNSNIRVSNFQVSGQAEYVVTLSYGDKTTKLNNGAVTKLSTILTALEISYTEEPTAIISSNPKALSVVANSDGTDYTVTSFTDFSDETTITISILNQDPIIITATSTQPATSEYGFFEPVTEVKLYAFCALPDVNGDYTKNNFDVCPGLSNWTLTNTYDIVNGVTMYHNYSEIMGSRVVPYGKDMTIKDNSVIGVEGYLIKSVPMLGYDYCQNEVLVQNAINALNYRKTYIESACELLENSFGADFKLFNTYGPSKTYYIIRDTNANSLLDDDREFIDRVDLSFYFRIKLVQSNDSYTKDNIIQEIKEYIEDLDDLGDLHIPNLVTQITTNYKEQVSYFEYLGFNDYGPEIQHLYKLDDSEIPIHVCPEFLNVRNNADLDGNLSPAINVYVSEI